MLTTEQVEREFAREFAFWEVVAHEDGWQVQIEVDGHGWSAHIQKDTTRQEVRDMIGFLMEMLAAVEDGEDFEGWLH